MPTPANQRCQPGMPQRQTALFPRLTGRLTEAAPAVMGTAAMRVRKQTVQRTCRRWRLVLASASLGRLIHPLQLRWWMDACSHLHLQGPACPVPCSRQQQGRKQAAVGNVHYWLEAAVRAVLLRRLLRGPRCAPAVGFYNGCTSCVQGFSQTVLSLSCPQCITLLLLNGTGAFGTTNHRAKLLTESGRR